MPNTDSSDAHEHFTRLLLESEPVMRHSILVSVPNLADARENLQDTALALWRQLETYDPERPFPELGDGILSHGNPFSTRRPHGRGDQ